MEIQDYILIHGKIINIKNNVDDKYIWFDISKDEYYKDKDGHMKNNPSFFSARISKILSNKYILDTNIEVVVKGIPKGFIDKKGYRQNYIHVTELNGCNLNEDIFEKIIDYDKDEVKQIRIHDFRHSCASLLINNGANIMIVAKYLGHAKIDETLNTYSHLFKNKMDDIVNLMNKLDI